LVGPPGLQFMSREEFQGMKKEGLVDEDPKQSHVDAEDRDRELKQFVRTQEQVKFSPERLEPELERVKQQQSKLNVENLDEQRHLSDLKPKPNRSLADCDPFIVRRVTPTDIPGKLVLLNRIHRLTDAQFEAVKDFLKSGRPALFSLGPANDPQRGGPPDSVE